MNSIAERDHSKQTILHRTVRGHLIYRNSLAIASRFFAPRGTSSRVTLSIDEELSRLSLATTRRSRNIAFFRDLFEDSVDIFLLIWHKGRYG